MIAQTLVLEQGTVDQILVMIWSLPKSSFWGLPRSLYTGSLSLD